MPPETWVDFIFKHGVEGALMVFIGALLSTRFYTVRHHEDVVKLLTDKCERYEADARFWRDYALRLDEKQVRVIEAQEQQLQIIAALKRDKGSS